MKEHIIPFSKTQHNVPEELWDSIGSRGKRIFELAQLELPISPGCIIDNFLVKKIEEVNLQELLQTYIESLEQQTGKTFGDEKNPLLLKVVLSPNLVLPNYPSIHNIGLNWDTVKGLAAHTNDEFALGEFLYLLKNVGKKILFKDDDKFSNFYDEIENSLAKLPKRGPKASTARTETLEEGIKKYLDYYKQRFSLDPLEQLTKIIIEGVKKYTSDEESSEGEELSVLIQAMVYGNYGDNSYSGTYYTRNKITGEDKLDGTFLQNAFDDQTSTTKAKEINLIDKKIHKDLSSIAKKIENHFKELRQIKFTVEQGMLWLVDQYKVEDKSTQAEIRTLIDLFNNKNVDLNYIVSQIPPGQLSELLHSVIDPTSVRGVPQVNGGIAGAPGAAVGRVFFSTPKLIEEFKLAQLKGADTRMILAVEASFAEDVKAIEVAQGVISVEGGYSSHAPVVARSLGKVAIVNPDIRLKATSFTLNGKTIKEGDYVTLDVPFYKEPTVYLGKASLMSPDPEKNGLMDYLALVDQKIGEFNVRVNGDSDKDVGLGRKFGAVGVGLCRTEHMFFEEKRINVFREMIIAQNDKERDKALKALLPMQKNDFYKIFKVMAGYPVTIRLLDAPLHEFIPRDKEAVNKFMTYIKTRKKGITLADLTKQFDSLHEFNPMLGHRGCRVGITYPEIYEMQVRAIFEAACMIKKEGIEVEPEIMVPIVMNKNELKFIRYGKRIEGRVVKGIEDIYDEVIEEYGISNLDYKVGTMIELPAAALNADEIAQYADFFSFGTNDLTQTTYGLSRDDINSFYGSYTEFDILANNPFQVLGDQVKELIGIAANRGYMTRPDIHLGLCGEHGADPENIKFLYNAGLHYVSTSPYSVPIAKLAVAQLMIEQEAEAK